MDTFEERQVITIPHEGQKMFGVLHTPIREGPFPCVFVTHGFAGNKIGYRRLYVMLAESLAKAGIATLRVDMRGCGDSEGSFSKVTIETLVSDSLRALEYLSDHKQIDSSRIGVLGVSLGGPVSVYTACQHAKLQSLALWAPVAEGERWQAGFAKAYPTEAVENHIRCGGETASGEFRDQFLKIRMDQDLAHLHDLPLLHVHGAADEVVFTDHAEVFRNARSESKADSHFVVLPNSNHNFNRDESERRILVDETTAWFKRTLS